VVDDADFTPDGRTARNTAMGPQDIKLAPDGSVFYIADSDQGGLWVLDGAATHVLREIPTGRGAHGLYLSRDATRLYVTNRQDSSVSVLDAYTGTVLTTWRLPGRGSPDMGNVTAP
jgi:DNA-binding beta-propeller fold protein YncE